jgi:DNA repair exonuclease SbcCD ATPase subunit
LGFTIIGIFLKKKFVIFNMIACPNCEFENEEDDIFCGNCGYNLSFKHTKTQTELPPISGDSLSQYQLLEDKIVNLEGIEDEVRQAYEYHQSLKTEAQGIELNYKKKQSEAKKEFKDVEELKKLTWKSLKSRISGKKEQLLETEEAEYFGAINKEEQAKKDFHEIMKRVNTAHKQLSELQGLAKKRLTLEKELEKLLDNLYRGGLGDQIENNLEKELENLIKEKNPINLKQAQLKNALGHLTNARDHFTEGMRKLDSAKGYSN